MISAILNSNNQVSGQPAVRRERSRTHLILRATLVTDPEKNIMIEVKVGDKIRYLQVMIGDTMKQCYPDDFE